MHVDVAQSKEFWEKLGAHPVCDVCDDTGMHLWRFGEGVQLYELPLQTIESDRAAGQGSSQQQHMASQPALICEAVYRRKLDAVMAELDAVVSGTLGSGDDVRAKGEAHSLCSRHRVANVNLHTNPKCIESMALGDWKCALVVGRAATRFPNGCLPVGGELTHPYSACPHAWKTCSSNSSNPEPGLSKSAYQCGCADCSKGDVALVFQH